MEFENINLPALKARIETLLAALRVPLELDAGLPSLFDIASGSCSGDSKLSVYYFPVVQVIQTCLSKPLLDHLL